MPGYQFARKTRISEDVARDIILHCTRAEQDVEFARRHGLTRSYVCMIRHGRAWADLRKRLREEGLR
jgi:hypothetical protein